MNNNSSNNPETSGLVSLSEFFPSGKESCSAALRDGFAMAAERAQRTERAKRSQRAQRTPPNSLPAERPAQRPALTQPPTIPAPLAHLSRGDQFEIFRKLVAGWRPEAISIHLERTKGLAVSPEAVQEFADAIPPEAYAAPNYLHSRYGDLVEVDPMLEIHYLLTSMRERYGAAILLEELEGRPNNATDKLAETFFNMLSGTVKLQQSQGDLPNKAPTSDPNAGGLKPLAVIINNGANGSSGGLGLANPRRHLLNTSAEEED